MKFSVLIANYNNARFIEECLQSIYNQSYTNYEIVIVDDCSTDGSIEIIQKHQQKHSEIKLYINSKNCGCGYTKRRCVEEATGEICGFVDPDDAIFSTAMEEMVKAHQRNPNTSLIHSRLKFYDENMNTPKERPFTPKVPKKSSYFLNANGEISHFVTFKKEYYNKTQGINPFLQRAVDLDLYLKLYEVGEIQFLNKFHYKYRIHKGGISKTSNIAKANYWRWVVNIETSKRRNINLEEQFVETFVTKKQLNEVKQKYYALKKFEPINNLWRKLKRKK